MTDEEYVRSVWEHTAIGQNWDGEWRLVLRCNVKRFIESDAEKCWSAAAEFTRERLEQIQQVEEEIQALVYHAVFPELDAVKLERILTREQAALAELKRGMK